MKKMLIIGMSLLAAGAYAQPDMAKYDKSCKICHATGTAGAPMVHDTAAWAPRLEKGMDALLVSVNQGLNAMPPKGMCFDCTSEDYIALIEFMSSPAPQ